MEKNFALVLQRTHFGMAYPDQDYPAVRDIVGDAVFLKLIRSEGTVIIQPVLIGRMGNTEPTTLSVLLSIV